MQPRHPLILIRHAQAEHHVRDITGGWTDTDLTRTGRRQAGLLARRLSQDLDGAALHLGTSNLRRAHQTAEILGEHLGVSPQVYAPLTDLNNGVAAGMTHAQARAFAIPPSEPLIDWQPYPQAESWRQFFERISRFMEQLDACQETLTILVTHTAAIHAIVAWWLGLPVESRTHFDAAPTSITVLRLTRWGERSLERLNDTAHLHAGGMTNPIRLAEIT